jgi:hypothetical protein
VRAALFLICIDGVFERGGFFVTYLFHLGSVKLKSLAFHLDTYICTYLYVYNQMSQHNTVHDTYLNDQVTVKY